MIRMRLSESAELLNSCVQGRDLEFSGCSIDSRTLSPGELFIALRGTQVDGHDYLQQAAARGAAAAMVEQECSIDILPTLKVAACRQAMSTLAAKWREKFSIPVVAITGSNGKTTVKEMITSILSQQAAVLSTQGNLNNDLGVPLTLFGLGEQHQYAVVEMGANHAGEIAQLTAISKPTVALITLCSPAHIEGFGSIEGVAHAKAEIFSGLRADGVAIINADDHYAGLWRQKADSKRQLSFAIDNPADITVRDLSVNKENAGSDFYLQAAAGEIRISLGLPGLHNVNNALAAAACCVAMGISLTQIAEGLQDMQAVSGRMQARTGIRNSRIYDDTYNANPASMHAAIRTACATASRCWLVMGDMGELGALAVSAHTEAGAFARATGVERLYTFGTLGEHATQAFGAGAQHFSDKDLLIDALHEELEDGLTVLVKGSRAMHMEQVVQSLLEKN